MENNEYNFKPEPQCPVVDIDGVIADGKQFDIDITLPKDKRNVIFGTVKDAYKDPVKDAVVKLVEIKYVRHYKVCAKIDHENDCLRGKPSHDCGCMIPDHKPDCKPEDRPEPRI